MTKPGRALVAILLVGQVAGPLSLRGAPAARAEGNGVGLRPATGWSIWSFMRHDPTAAKVEATARAMVTRGLARVGYRHVNVDDFWYICSGPQGPGVDRYGRWVPNSGFPRGPHGENGIQVVAAYAARGGVVPGDGGAPVGTLSPLTRALENLERVRKIRRSDDEDEKRRFGARQSASSVPG